MNYRVRESLELEKKKKILKFPLLPQMAQLVKNLPASAGDTRDMGSIPGWGRSPGGGHGNALQYSCLENPMDGGARRAHGAAESDTAERLNTHAQEE